MTPEERAIAFWGPRPRRGHVATYEGNVRLLSDIIRNAEREAVERIAEAFSVGTSVTHRPIHPQDVANRIRTLNK